MTIDAELLAASGSDARAFRRLYDRYAASIHRFHRGRTGDADAALDLTAETFAEREPRDASDDWLDGLDEALEALAPDLREAVELRVVDDLTYDELAARSGTTAGAARVRVHRGLKALRERLTREEAAG
jgi:DNA-directed RNA polymerase specialized sigma24 family protein